MIPAIVGSRLAPSLRGGRRTLSTVMTNATIKLAALLGTMGASFVIIYRNTCRSRSQRAGCGSKTTVGGCDAPKMHIPS